ncbi:beta--endoglucanase [Moniliophthora roreri]|nr:beta--endoglucanase [Moniliophthora roreri]
MKSLSSLLFFAAAVCAQSAGVTTRYWDCCKPSSPRLNEPQASVTSPVRTCDRNGNTLGPDVKSGCDGGTAFTCTNNAPWAVDNNTAYGFAAVRLSGQTESRWCCACYELTFTNGPASGKKMIVQATNTGGDLGNNHFDILIPGGGVSSLKDVPLSLGAGTGGRNTVAFPAVTNVASFLKLSRQAVNSVGVRLKEAHGFVTDDTQ